MRGVSDGERKAVRRTAMLALRATVALPFLIAGSVKLIGTSGMVSLFDEIGVGQWFRYVTGVLEVAGGILVISRHWLFGSIILSCVAAGAAITHLGVIGGSPVPAAILLALSAWLATLGLGRASRRHEAPR